MFSTVRLSKHFLLSDMIHNASYLSQPGRAPMKLSDIPADGIEEGMALCEELLEPMIAAHGPCSIAAGYAANATGPHNWCRREGAAVDAAFHDWVNADRAPIKMVEQVVKNGLPFERVITYAGSEFVCLAHRKSFRRHACYENVRIPGADKPRFRTLNKDPGGLEKLREMEFPDRPHWRRLEGEPIYHTCRCIRPQHIRVSRYFTLLDFCRSELAVERGVSPIIPMNAHRQIEMARCAGEVLDGLVGKVGRVSVLRGAESNLISAAQSHTALHRWTDDVGRVSFVVPEGTDIGAIQLDHGAVEDVQVTEHPTNSFHVAVEFRRFDYAQKWSSGREAEPSGTSYRHRKRAVQAELPL